MKAAIHDGAAISAVNPRHYSHRFKGISGESLLVTPSGSCSLPVLKRIRQNMKYFSVKELIDGVSRVSDTPAPLTSRKPLSRTIKPLQIIDLTPSP